MITAEGAKGTTDIETDADGYRFNDDLLVDEAARKQVQRIYPRIFHVLDHPELRHMFGQYDPPANAAKTRSRRAGLAAIVCATFALLSASATPLYHDLPLPWPQIISIASAAVGLVSVGIGFFGVLFLRQKRQWLQKRLMTERLRQFHFQTLVARWTDIVQSLESEEGLLGYINKRSEWFEGFRNRFSGHLSSELTNTLIDESESNCWLHEFSSSAPPSEINPGLSELFSAYRRFRIIGQLDFASHKLSDGEGERGWPARTQERVFSYTSLICILIIFVIHLWSAFDNAISMSRTVVEQQSAPLIHVVIVWTAIAALVVRALQEGLQPEREIERYRHYAAAIRAVRDRFDESKSSAKKLEIMREMERVSFDEMRNFLRSGNEARFVM